MALFLSIARHGETTDNARRIFQGQAGSGLNPLGRAQAARLAERVRRAPPDLIIASDLERAIETARIVRDACGAHIDLELDKGLREVDVGKWTGKGYDEVATLFPEEWAAWERGIDIRRGGGETYGELADRVDRCIQAIAIRYASKRRILLVSHGGAIKSWVSKILGGASADGLRALAGVTNTGITVVERDARGRHRLHTWNDSAHLDGLNAEEHGD